MKIIKKDRVIDSRDLRIPAYDRIKNFGSVSFKKTADLIDKIKSPDKEWEKTKVFIKDKEYVNFLKNITGSETRDIVRYLKNFYEDSRFKKIFLENLKILEGTNNAWGDMRFHSLSLYVIIRAVKPEIVIETGVASGKSSSLILLALEHNAKGKLFSVDLPNYHKKVLADTIRAGWCRTI